MIKIIVLLLWVLATALTADVKDTINIAVFVDGFKNNDGHCRLLIFDSDKGFPQNPEYAVIIAAGYIENRKAEFVINIEPGEYSITVLHDENSNEKMDTTWFGKPKEGFGFSNNPKVSFRAPKFADTQVLIDEDNKVFLITLIYL